MFRWNFKIDETWTQNKIPCVESPVSFYAVKVETIFCNLLTLINASGCVVHYDFLLRAGFGLNWKYWFEYISNLLLISLSIPCLCRSSLMVCYSDNQVQWWRRMRAFLWKFTRIAAKTNMQNFWPGEIICAFIINVNGA